MLALMEPSGWLSWYSKAQTWAEAFSILEAEALAL